jgi:LPXTG-motif cell wall-anchored protein
MTVAAAFTQIAVSTQTIIATSTALPRTGIAEDLGAPGLLMMALALVAVIFLVRRLRAAPTK